MQKITSSFLSLNIQDILKGLIVAAGGAAVAAIETSLSAGELSFNWKQIGLTALAAGVSYLGKNLFTKPTIVTPVK